MLKRSFDFVMSLLGIVLSIPLWLLIWLTITLEDGPPVFYSQQRVGKSGRVFRALKFRSMINDAERDSGPIQALENDPRVTKIGRILRATAMDELPQLINILKGDMSFSGPRALRRMELGAKEDPSKLNIQEVPGYRERLTVRPGLTGLAQVYLPRDAPREKKFWYDRLYIKRQSLSLDINLILLSFWITFRGKWERRASKF
jgi:lipopolysaccharide/colanic/teichoic acid biosynthesis glycosyltransferase